MNVLRTVWGAMSWAVRGLVFAGLVILGLALALVFTGGSSKSAASTTTTVVTPAAPASAPSTTSSTTTTSTAPTTPASSTTASASTPAAVATGGGPMAGSSATSSSGSCDDGSQPSTHGLVTTIKLDGPVTDGGSTGISITVCKVSGDPVELPNLKVGESFDGRPFDYFAVLNLPPDTYTFLDKQRNLFNLPTLAVGDSFTVSGTVNVPDRGNKPAANFCIAAAVEMIGTTPTYNAEGYPIPNWTDPVTQTCVRYTVQ